MPKHTTILALACTVSFLLLPSFVMLFNRNSASNHLPAGMIRRSIAIETDRSKYTRGFSNKVLVVTSSGDSLVPICETFLAFDESRNQQSLHADDSLPALASAPPRHSCPQLRAPLLGDTHTTSSVLLPFKISNRCFAWGNCLCKIWSQWTSFDSLQKRLWSAMILTYRLLGVQMQNCQCEDFCAGDIRGVY